MSDSAIGCESRKTPEVEAPTINLLGRLSSFGLHSEEAEAEAVPASLTLGGLEELNQHALIVVNERKAVPATIGNIFWR